MNYKMIFYTLGWVLRLESLCMAPSLLCALLYKETKMASIFIVCMALCIAVGVLLSLKKPVHRSMYAKEGFVTVAMSWIMMSIFGAFPFWFSGVLPHYLDALFETVSGFTTTGASVIQNLDIVPNSLLFWRSFTHWIGGMGVLVFLVAILPLAGGSTLYLIQAESPGPSVNKLVPKVRATAKLLYKIYLAMTILEIILLLLGKMPLFDALTLSFGTAGTGGFGIRNDSIGGYSPYCQVVITVFMLLFGVDFAVYHLLLLKKFHAASQATEVRAYFLIVLCAIAFITTSCISRFNGFWEALRHSSFQVASIITTTGYATTDFNLWAEFPKTILVTLMFVGACAGSTGGGIKVSRILIWLKSIAKEIKTAAHPRNTVKLTLGGRTVAHETVRAVNVFMAAYILIFALSLLLISLDNFDFTTNFTAIAATINNIGPGLGGVGPISNFAGYSALSTFIFILDMLIGRLEIFPILVLFSPYTWRK